MFVVAVAVVFLGAVAWLISNGFRDYPSYCETYTDDLQQAHTESGQYPTTLSGFKEAGDPFNRYSPDDCGYGTEGEQYYFFVSSGFGVAIYYSDQQQWIYD